MESAKQHAKTLYKSNKDYIISNIKLNDIMFNVGPILPNMKLWIFWKYVTNYYVKFLIQAGYDASARIVDSNNGRQYSIIIKQSKS